MTEARAQESSSMEAEQVLQTLLRYMGFEAHVERYEGTEGEVLLHVSTAEPAPLIGRNAQVLEALQTVVNRMMRTGGEEGPVRYVVDIERYRERRKDRLVKMAYEAADRVLRSGRSVKLPPMNAHDRRIIHQALKDRKGIKTTSEPAQEGLKRIVVSRG